MKDFSLDDLDVLQELGRGACSIVSLARHKRDGTLVGGTAQRLLTVPAGAEADQHREQDAARPAAQRGESLACGRLTPQVMMVSQQHENVVRVFQAFVRDDSASVVFAVEFMDRGDLQNLIKKAAHIPEPIASVMIRDALLGLQFLHGALHTMHRDVKPANMLINSAGIVRRWVRGLY